MFGQFLIAFREILEASLIVAIMLAYFTRTGRKSLTRYVLYGVFLAVLASVFLGGIVWLVYGSLSEVAQLLFEATAAFVAVAVLSSMIYWMALKGRHLRREIERQFKAIVTRGAVVGLVTAAFILVFREGVETVLFLTPFLAIDTFATIGGMLAGVLAAVLISFFVFVVGLKINLSRFFYFSSIMLVLLAGGLAGYGVHELMEYYAETGMNVGWLGQPAYDLNIPEGSPFHHKGIVGSIFAVMFGYAVKPEWSRVIVHTAYLAIALPLVMWIYRRSERDIET